MAGLALRKPLPQGMGGMILPVDRYPGAQWVAGEFEATNNGRSHERGSAP